MPIKDLLSALRGLLVISREEGANLGVVSRVYLDTDSCRISALALAPRRGWKSRRFVPAQHIVAVGRDVVTISSETAVQETEEGHKPVGKSLKDLQGMWVTTDTGAHIGHLVDFDVVGEEWRISELRLAEDKSLTIEAAEIKIGQDEIIVPEGYVDRLKEVESEPPGILARIFGKESVEETREAIKRTIKRSAEKKKKGRAKDE